MRGISAISGIGTKNSFTTKEIKCIIGNRTGATGGIGLNFVSSKNLNSMTNYMNQTITDPNALYVASDSVEHTGFLQLPAMNSRSMEISAVWYE